MSDDNIGQNRRQIMKAAGLLAGIGTTSTLATGTELDNNSTDKGANQTPHSETSTSKTSDEACLFDDPGLVTVESDRGFDETVATIKQRIDKSPLTLISTVDHAANADSVDLDLPPTTVLIFGNPKIGTQLMQTSRSIGIDLPQKILIWREDETVHITYNDPQYLAARHGVEDKDNLLQQITMALEKLATGGKATTEATNNGGNEGC